tara:strand:+ start:12332 stop:12976 length:645 start_codon:yes stop_codon:yes gene_type:complete
MREKFLSNSKSLLDYEILEMLLFSSSSRKDTKLIAKTLLIKFGSISNIINADDNLLKECSNVTDSVLVSIKLIKEVIIRESKDKVTKVNVIDNWQEMLKYCQNNIANLKNEKMHILFLDKQYKLISDRVYGGYESIDNIIINKNNIIKDALNLSCSYVILCHNHPSDNPKPSRKDISNTKKIKDYLENIAIKMLDHIIVTKSGRYYSFQEDSML